MCGNRTWMRRRKEAGKDNFEQLEERNGAVCLMPMTEAVEVQEVSEAELWYQEDTSAAGSDVMMAVQELNGHFTQTSPIICLKGWGVGGGISWLVFFQSRTIQIHKCSYVLPQNCWLEHVLNALILQCEKQGKGTALHGTVLSILQKCCLVQVHSGQAVGEYCSNPNTFTSTLILRSHFCTMLRQKSLPKHPLYPFRCLGWWRFNSLHLAPG